MKPKLLVVASLQAVAHIFIPVDESLAFIAT